MANSALCKAGIQRGPADYSKKIKNMLLKSHDRRQKVCILSAFANLAGSSLCSFRVTRNKGVFPKIIFLGGRGTLILCLHGNAQI